MRDFSSALASAADFGRQMAARELRRVVVEVFGSTDRPACKRDGVALCGVHVYFPNGGERLELWYCQHQRTGEIFASDNIEKAKAFPIFPTVEEKRAIKKEIERFAGDVQAALVARLLAPNGAEEAGL